MKWNVGGGCIVGAAMGACTAWGAAMGACASWGAAMGACTAWGAAMGACAAWTEGPTGAGEVGCTVGAMGACTGGAWEVSSRWGVEKPGGGDLTAGVPEVGTIGKGIIDLEGPAGGRETGE